MGLSVGYLTPTQLLMWDRRRSGLPEATIARKLDVSRQTVHKALGIAHEKIYESLEETAKINKIKIQKVDPVRGYLLGYSSHFKTRSLIVFSVKNGIQVWYDDEGDCKNCSELQACRDALIAEAKERNLPLPPNEQEIVPSEFSNKLFAAITGGKA